MRRWLLTMAALTAWIVYEALIRIREPQPVAGATVMVVAAIGLLMNLFLARQLAHQHDDLNLRAVFLHVISDLLGSVAALVAGTVVWLTGWTPIDPLLSILAAGLILASAIRVLRDALNVLMEGVPRGIDLEAVGRALAGIPTVRAVHDLHVWTLASGTAALSAHIEMAGMDAWPQILREARRVMREQFGISHITLQPELVPSLRPRGGKVIPIRERPGRGG